MIDPTTAAAIITASGAVIEKLLELAGKSEPPAQAKKTIDKAYDKLHPAITPNCVRVLIALRKAGSKQSLGQLYASAARANHFPV